MHENREFPHIVTVKSSAGAGKTYNLALRYLQLLSTGNPGGQHSLESHISNIVAITFTNKAASEMRSRIIDWMKRIILDLPFEGSSRKPIDAVIPDLSDAQARVDLIRSLERDFEHLIKNYYDFKVSTIDSFVNLTLKASAFKLGLPPDFEISTESALYVDSVLQGCLQEILESTEIRRKFDTFLYSYIETEGENTSWNPKTFLKETVYRFWKEEAKENKEFTYEPDGAGTMELRKETAENAREMLRCLETSNGIKLHKTFLKALLYLGTLDRSDFKGSAYFKRATLSESLNKGSAIPDDACEEAWQHIRALIARLVETLAETKFSSYIEIYKLFKERLRVEVTYRRRIILIEELNKLLQDVICGEDFIPEIYYALAERYFHFLIDEFQDTNHLQWKNIAVLAEEALSRGGTLFLVGDKKQAIYRWRGGRSELVDEIVGDYSSYRQYPVCLDTNYRSGGHIIAFNNLVFNGGNLASLLDSMTKDADSPDLGRIIDAYSESWQQCLESKKEEGYVYVEKIIQESEDGEREERFSKDDKQRIVAEKVRLLVREIREKHAYEEGEIAVLVRRREEAELIVKKLLEMGLSVDSEYTVNVKNNPLVKEIIGFLQFISAPHDDIALVGFLTGAIFGTASEIPGDEMMEWITKERLRDNSRPLYISFQSAYPALWDRHFNPFFKGAGYLPLYELFVLTLKGWEVLSSFSEEVPYFLHICELIKKREGAGDNNLTGFLQFWRGDALGPVGANPDRDAPFLLKAADGVNAIKVLTIHKAKGLQFPVVILPFLKMTPFGSSDSRDKGKFFVSDEQSLRLLYVKKDFIGYSPKLDAIYCQKESEYLIDEINNIYVACTRAEKELYILLADGDRQRNLLADYLFKIEALQKWTTGHIIERGVKQEGTGGRISGDEPEQPREEGTFFPGNIGKDLKWMEKVKGKFEQPEGCSLEQVFAKKKGDVIHYILSRISSLPEDFETFIEESVHQALVRFGFLSRKEEITAVLTGFFAHQPFRRFFLLEDSCIVYTEKELVTRTGDTYKVDRIIIHDDFIDVVDFKTGETRRAEHIEQIRNYGNLLREIHKDKEIRQYLLYIDEHRVEAV